MSAHHETTSVYRTDTPHILISVTTADKRIWFDSVICK